MVHHGEVAFECKEDGANGFDEEVGELDGVQYFGCAFHIAGFHIALYEAHGADEEMTEDADECEEIEYESSPKTTVYIHSNTAYQQNDSKGQAIFDKPVKPLHKIILWECKCITDFRDLAKRI